MNSSRDPLDSLLAKWRVQPAAHPAFRSEVWQRIAAAGQPVNWARFARAHPALVSGALGVALAVGAWTGREQARAHAADESNRLAESYVQSLDARTMTMP
jgi:hypothetical protein